MENKFLSLKPILGTFCLGDLSNKSNFIEAKEVLFKRNVYNFSVNYHAIGKSDILNIRKYLMVKKNNKMFGSF